MSFFTHAAQVFLWPAPLFPPDAVDAGRGARYVSIPSQSPGAKRYINILDTQLGIKCGRGHIVSRFYSMGNFKAGTVIPGAENKNLD